MPESPKLFVSVIVFLMGEKVQGNGSRTVEVKVQSVLQDPQSENENQRIRQKLKEITQ